MRVIEFKYQDQEILRYRPNKRINLIGRASNCEIVLRRKNIQPVHFVLEWVGEGEFDENSGQWIIVDVTGKEKTERDVGLGVVLRDSALKLGDYSVRLIEDTLAQTDIHRGVLSRNLTEVSNQTLASGSSLPSRKDFAAEILTFSKSLDKIVNVEHFAQMKSVGRISPFQDLKNVQFIWTKNHKDIAFIENSGESVDFKLNHVRANTAITLAQGNKFEMNKTDFISLETSKFRYFIRLVPEVRAQQEAMSWLKDKSILIILFFFLGLFGLYTVLPSYVPLPVESEVPLRVARIEVQETPPPPVKVPEPLPIEKPEPTPVEEVKIEEPKPKPPEPTPTVVENKPPKKIVAPDVAPEKSVSPTPVNVKNTKSEKPGLNSPAPVKDVNTVGILGKLRSNQKTAKIDANDLSDYKTNDLAIADRGVVVNQPKMGSLESNLKKSSDLAGASTTLQNSKANAQNFAQNKVGISTTKSASGSSLGQAGDAAGSGSGGRGTLGDDGEGEMDVVGGLDKETVRRAIRENRKALANCFETGLLKKKNLGGRVTLRWRIKAEGPVENIAVQSSNTGLQSFDECVSRVIKGIVFAKAPNKQPTVVTFPFQFKERNK